MTGYLIFGYLVVGVTYVAVSIALYADDGWAHTAPPLTIILGLAYAVIFWPYFFVVDIINGKRP